MWHAVARLEKDSKSAAHRRQSGVNELFCGKTPCSAPSPGHTYVQVNMQLNHAGFQISTFTYFVDGIIKVYLLTDWSRNNL